MAPRREKGLGAGFILSRVQCRVGCNFVFGSVADAVSRAVLVVGVPLLVVLFLLEGLIMGKLLQAPAVFVTVVAVARPNTVLMAFLVAGCTVAVVLGQWVVFRSFNPDDARRSAGWTRWPRVQRLPAQVIERVGDRRLATIDRWFVRHGGLAVFVSTFLPLVRGTLAVPAGMSAYPRRRFLLVTLGANVTYFLVLTGVAFGILRVLGG